MTRRGDVVGDPEFASVHTHFWSPVDDEAALAGWDPDVEPTRFSDGRGHALLELFVRLRARGAAVSIGPTPPRAAQVVVVFSKDLAFWHSLRFALTSSHLPVVVIESDWSRRRTVPVSADVLVRSCRADVQGVRDVALALLPQRGLVPRHPERLGRVRTLGFHGDPSQAPEFLADPAFIEALNDTGVEVRVADRSTWHDFSEADAVLCMRRTGLPTDHKPPTKLVNAWAAGCIPLVAPERSYTEWATDGHDALAVTDADSVLDACRRLTLPEFVASIESRCAVQRELVTRDAILDQWIEVISRAASAGSRRRAWRVVGAFGYWVRAQTTRWIGRSSLR
jgi:hypothetical protein